MQSLIRLLMFPLLLVIAGSAFGATQPVPAAPRLSSPSYVLMDFNSGYLISAKNEDTRLEPASLTKMMTAYVVYSELASGSLSMDDVTVVSEKAWRMGGSRMFIEVDKEVAISDLVKGLIVQSGNDASVALAEAVAGSEAQFADYMNNFAAKLGMSNSNFVNSTGLPDENHYTSARDMAILAQALIRDFPEKYKLYSQREFTYNNIRQYNRNKLLWRDPSVDGIKTGHTEAAGYCLVTSAERSGMRIISVVMGAKSEKVRTSESKRLLDYAFQFYKTQRIYAGSETLDSPRIWKGEAKTLPLGLADDLFVTVPRGQRSTLKTSLLYSPELVAPIDQGSELGTLQVKLGDEVIAERPLIALASVAEGGFLQRALDTVLQYFR